MATPAYAEEVADDLDAMLELDLSDLTVVSVASKKEESTYDAPSVVSVVTKEDIRRYGSRNLIDVLNRMPSFQFTNGQFFQNISFQVRGQSNQHYSNRMLFLINGRPFRDSFSGGFSMPFFKGFPVSTIERIEVIRGPGSVLYGSNAFAAVINVVTRKTKDGESENSVAATYGTEFSRAAEGTMYRSGPEWNVMAAVRASAQEGPDTRITSELATTGKFGQEGHDNSFTTSAKFGNLSLNAFHGREEHDGLFRTFTTDERDTTRTFFDVGYTHEINDDWQVTGNVTHNRMDTTISNVLSGIPEISKTDDTIAELNVRGDVAENWSVMFGGTHEYQHGLLHNTPEFSTRWYSAYGQAEYTPLENLKLVAGVQMNKPGAIQEDFSPRGGAIYHLNKNWGGKLLYGQAFRSGYAAETALIIPGILRGNPNLKPEKTATTEAQIFYHDDKTDATLTAYHSRVTNVIGRGPAVPGPGLTALNTGKVEFRGVEFEGKHRIGGGWETQGSIMWQENEDGTGVTDVTLSPNLMAKLGVSYSSPKGYTFGLFDSYFGDPTQVNKFNAAAAQVNKAADNYHLVSFNAEFDVDKLIAMGNTVPDMTFIVFADNLLGKDIYYPEYNRRNTNSFPVFLGRSVYGTLRVGF